MPTVSIQIPMIGEGLREARLVAVLKQPGDRVRRDEPIYQMETDKAVMDVESPHEGVLVEWLAEPGTMLLIGADVARMEIATAGEAPAPVAHAPAAAAPSASNIVPLMIPMIGEGLQEARLVAVLKQPGETIRRDEAIYQMETDKAVMDVESPYSGTLIRWTAEPGTLLPIGAQVAEMEVSEPVTVSAPSHGHAPASTASAAPVAAPSAETGARRTDIPPRTRAYAKEKGLSEADLAKVPASGARLMPADIDAFLAGGGAPAKPAAAASAPAAVPASSKPHGDRTLSQKQRLLSSRLVRGNQLVVPGTISVATRWEQLDALRNVHKAKGGDFQPSAFTMFAYCVVQALKNAPLFRSSLVNDDTVRTYDHVYLGIAVALPGDELALAVVNEADKLSWPEFAAATREQIDRARNGEDQAHEAVTISLTNMQAFGLRDAVPVVVPPAVGTLYLGEVYRGIDQSQHDLNLVHLVNLALTFDHRLINGVGAATFINDVKHRVESVMETIPGP